MRYLVTNGQMKQADGYTIHELGIPSAVLMERAALCVADEVMGRARPGDHVWAACGAGNNGADGIAAARILFLKGYDVTVLIADGDAKGSQEYAMQRSIAEKLGIKVFPFRSVAGDADSGRERCDILIDAVFGVGLSRPVEGLYGEFLEFLGKARPGFTVAVDLPSGIHGDDGRVMGLALPADVTVSFGWEKRGSALYPGKGLCGRILVRDIGFPEEAIRRACPDAYTYGPEDLGRIPERPAYSNKGTFGKVLVIAGSSRMCGAAYLSALAAYRAGAGLVKVLTVEENRQALHSLLPEAVLETFEPEAVLRDEEEGFAWLEGQCGWAGSIVLGPGLGTEPYAAALVEGVLSHAYVPMVLDADALNIIACRKGLAAYFTDNIVITPHLGEMSRLTGRDVTDLQGNLLEAAREFGGRHGVTVVLKDAATVVALRDGDAYVNSSGNSVLAVAGSGDVLSGVIGALLASGMEPGEAACMGVYLHGLAGDMAREAEGDCGALAGELAGWVRKVLAGRKGFPEGAGPGAEKSQGGGRPAGSWEGRSARRKHKRCTGERYESR